MREDRDEPQMHSHSSGAGQGLASLTGQLSMLSHSLAREQGSFDASFCLDEKGLEETLKNSSKKDAPSRAVGVGSVGKVKSKSSTVAENSALGMDLGSMQDNESRPPWLHAVKNYSDSLATHPSAEDGPMYGRNDVGDPKTQASTKQHAIMTSVGASVGIESEKKELDECLLELRSMAPVSKEIAESFAWKERERYTDVGMRLTEQSLERKKHQAVQTAASTVTNLKFLHKERQTALKTISSLEEKVKDMQRRLQVSEDSKFSKKLRIITSEARQQVKRSREQQNERIEKLHHAAATAIADEIARFKFEYEANRDNERAKLRTQVKDLQGQILDMNLNSDHRRSLLEHMVKQAQDKLKYSTSKLQHWKARYQAIADEIHSFAATLPSSLNDSNAKGGTGGHESLEKLLKMLKIDMRRLHLEAAQELEASKGDRMMNLVEMQRFAKDDRGKEDESSSSTSELDTKESFLASKITPEMTKNERITKQEVSIQTSPIGASTINANLGIDRGPHQESIVITRQDVKAIIEQSGGRPGDDMRGLESLLKSIKADIPGWLVEETQPKFLKLSDGGVVNKTKRLNSIKKRAGGGRAKGRASQQPSKQGVLDISGEGSGNLDWSEAEDSEEDEAKPLKIVSESKASESMAKTSMISKKNTVKNRIKSLGHSSSFDKTTTAPFPPPGVQKDQRLDSDTPAHSRALEGNLHHTNLSSSKATMDTNRASDDETALPFLRNEEPQVVKAFAGTGTKTPPPMELTAKGYEGELSELWNMVIGHKREKWTVGLKRLLNDMESTSVNDAFKILVSTIEKLSIELASMDQDQSPALSKDARPVTVRSRPGSAVRLTYARSPSVHQGKTPLEETSRNYVSSKPTSGTSARPQSAKSANAGSRPSSAKSTSDSLSSARSTPDPSINRQLLITQGLTNKFGSTKKPIQVERYGTEEDGGIFSQGKQKSSESAELLSDPSMLDEITEESCSVNGALRQFEIHADHENDQNHPKSVGDNYPSPTLSEHARSASPSISDQDPATTVPSKLAVIPTSHLDSANTSHSMPSEIISARQESHASYPTTKTLNSNIRLTQDDSRNVVSSNTTTASGGNHRHGIRSDQVAHHAANPLAKLNLHNAAQPATESHPPLHQPPQGSSSHFHRQTPQFSADRADSLQMEHAEQDSSTSGTIGQHRPREGAEDFDESTTNSNILDLTSVVSNFDVSSALLDPGDDDHESKGDSAAEDRKLSSRQGNRQKSNNSVLSNILANKKRGTGHTRNVGHPRPSTTDGKEPEEEHAQVPHRAQGSSHVTTKQRPSTAGYLPQQILPKATGNSDGSRNVLVSLNSLTNMERIPQRPATARDGSGSQEMRHRARPSTSYTHTTRKDRNSVVDSILQDRQEAPHTASNGEKKQLAGARAKEPASPLTAWESPRPN